MAKRKSQEPKTFAYEEFMARARKEGRVRNETLSMKALKPDLSLQARVNHIDVDHVRALHDILKGGQQLAPIVVFEVAPGKFKIADGFHRHEVYRREKAPGIPCVVVTGTLQEAIEYAASANQSLSLKRTREDAKKAVFMLFENGWIDRPVKATARQAGVTPLTARKYSNEYRDANNIEVPKGQKPTALGPRLSTYREKDGRVRTRYWVTLNGAKVNLGSTERDALRRYESLTNGEPSTVGHVGPKADPSLTSKRLSDVLAMRGVTVDPVVRHGSLKFLSGGLARGWAFTYLSVDHANVQDLCRAVISAIGRALVLAEYYGVSNKSVVTRLPFGRFPDLIEIARGLGVEVMTLDEFVAAAKADADSAAAV